MSIAILTKPYCKTAFLTFFYFLLKGNKISNFIVESDTRSIFSDEQLKFTKSHEILELYELNFYNKPNKYKFSLILFHITNKLINLVNLFFGKI